MLPELEFPVGLPFLTALTRDSLAGAMGSAWWSEDSARNATGEAESGPLGLPVYRSVKLARPRSSISSEGGLLRRRELDDAFGLTGLAANVIADPQVAKHGRYRLAGLLRQSVFAM